MGRLQVGSVMALAVLSGLVGCSDGSSDRGSGAEAPTVVPATTGPGTRDPVAGPAVAVATGEESACAIAGAGRTAGRVWCWSLLDHTTDTREQAHPWDDPDPVADLPPAAEIDGSRDEWCALTTTGELWCWEDRFRYAIGAEAPARIALPGPATAMAVGPHRGCALVEGDAWCWSRQYGTRPAGRGRPVHTDLGSAATDVAVGGNHTCVLLADRSIRCWGYNGAGELGDGNGRTALDRSEDPVTPTGLDPATSVLAGDNDSCAVPAEGTVSCWGNHPALPPEPTSTTSIPPINRSPCYTCPNRVEVRTPAPVAGTDGTVSLSMASGPGIGAICAVRIDTTVACWGPPYGGRLGRDAPPSPTGTGSPTPVQVPGLRGITEADVGMRNMCAVDHSGHVSCIGTYALDDRGNPRYVLDPVRLESFG